MKISEEDVLRVAELSRLELDADEVPKVARQLDAILSYVAKLDELDTSQVEPTTHILSLSQPLREDKPTPLLSQETAVKNAPLTDGESFIVPRVI
jgi:aspartyl-tRNA(Asn)/glutamyl-tRNA(Gln) amidotransferase subunit C